MKHANILMIELVFNIPYAHSLKEKRQPVKSIKQRLQNRFNASVAEIDALESWQKAVLGLVMLSNDKVYLQQQASKIEQLVIDEADMELIDFNQTFI